VSRGAGSLRVLAPRGHPFGGVGWVPKHIVMTITIIIIIKIIILVIVLSSVAKSVRTFTRVI